MFNTKSIRVSLPKAQYRQLISLLDQMNSDDGYDIDDLIQLAVSDLLDKYFSDTAKRVARNLKRVAK